MDLMRFRSSAKAMNSLGGTSPRRGSGQRTRASTAQDLARCCRQLGLVVDGELSPRTAS